jgi:hypothetical protein
MIYTAPYVMCLIRADPLYEGKWEGIEPWKSRLFGLREMASAGRLVPFGAHKTLDYQGPTPSHLPK